MGDNLNNMTPAVIFEDNHIIVVIKPQGVPTQADDSGDTSLQQQIQTYIKEASGKTGNVFCGIVHRLDRMTGGVMVLAKTSKAAERLCAQIKEHTFQKKYLAVIVGEPKSRNGQFIDYLLKDDEKNKVSVVNSAVNGAKQAILDYKLLNTVDAKLGGESKKISLVEINLETGRSHQIRVQFASRNMPLFADAKYGSVIKGTDLALWATELSFTHPTKGEELRFIVNPPETLPWTLFDFGRKQWKTR